MTQSERDEEAAATFEYERMRAEGVSLQEIGAGKVKIARQEDGEVVPVRADDLDSNDEKIDVKRTEVV